MLDYSKLLETTQSRFPEHDPKEQRKIVLDALISMSKKQEKSLLACLWDIYYHQDWVTEETPYPNFNHYVHELFPDDYHRIRMYAEIVQYFLAEVQVLSMEGLLSRVTLPDTGEIVEVTPQYLLDRPEMISRLMLAQRAFSKISHKNSLTPETSVEQSEYPETVLSPETSTPLPTGIKRAEDKLIIIQDMLTAPSKESYINRLEAKGYKEHRFSDVRIPCRTFASKQQVVEELSQVEGEGSVVVLYNLNSEMLDIIQNALKRHLEKYG